MKKHQKYRIRYKSVFEHTKLLNRTILRGVETHRLNTANNGATVDWLQIDTVLYLLPQLCYTMRYRTMTSIILRPRKNKLRSRGSDSASSKSAYHSKTCWTSRVRHLQINTDRCSQMRVRKCSQQAVNVRRYALFSKKSDIKLRRSYIEGLNDISTRGAEMCVNKILPPNLQNK